jgi:D-3-phosphoglycerate dehydrogenase
MKILVTEPESCHPDYMRLLEEIGEVSCKSVRKEELSEIIGSYDILVIGVETIVDESVLKKAKRLKIIGSHTTGIDHINVDCANKLGIEVITLRDAPEILKTVSATAEHTMALLLSLVRRIPWAFDAVREERWERSRFFGVQLKDKKMGIIGYGRLGRMVVRYGLCFGMSILVYDPYLSQKDITQKRVNLVGLDELLKESDIISIHVKLTEKTENLIGRREFCKMEKRPFFVNTSRGRVVDEEALLEALERGWIRGAAIDVLRTETTSSNPLSENLLVKYAKKHQNLLITPHLGGATEESMRTTGLYIGKKIKELMRK